MMQLNMKNFLITLLIIFFPLLASAQDVALISDIHYGNEAKRVNRFGNYDYPKKAEKLFKKQVKEIKKRGIKLLIVLGDSTNKNDLKRFKQLTKDLKGLNTIWIKGNHDGNYWLFRNMDKIDFGDFQVITLDSTLWFPTSVGYLSEIQKKFVLENLDKPTIIAMHHPIYICGTPQVIPEYAEFKQQIDNSNNVIAVLSGHCHEPNQQGRYITIGSLTIEKHYQLLNF